MGLELSEPPRAEVTVRPWRAYSEAIATVICERARRGETLTSICADESLPCRATVQAWARTRPAFGARLLAAVKAGRGTQAGRRPVWCPHVAALICQRIALGMTTRQALDLPGMPCETTVYGWLQTVPAFREAYGRARLWQAHRRFDQVWEIAEAAEPGTAFVSRVKISAAQWQASRLAPTRYGAKSLGEDGAQADEDAENHVVRVTKFGRGPGEESYVDVPFPLKRVGRR
jgi:hypothetical protein